MGPAGTGRTRPEVEWGFEPALREDILDRLELRPHRLAVEHPREPGGLVADLYRQQYAGRGAIPTVPSRRPLLSPIQPAEFETSMESLVRRRPVEWTEHYGQ